jgi:Flp pilus assembly protein TadG
MSNLTTNQYHPSNKVAISGRRPSTTRASRQRGSAILELAIAVPLLTMVLAGTMELGRAYYAAAEVANAARAGVQFAAINPANASNSAGMQQAAKDDAMNVSGLTATASKFCECSDGTSVDCTTGSCSGKRTYVKVATSVQFQTIGTYPGIPSPFTIGSQATMRVQ